jgi:hypothetical protein
MKNAELKEQVAELSEIKQHERENDIMTILEGVPEERVQSFIDNQLRTFILLEKSRVVQQYKKDQL